MTLELIGEHTIDVSLLTPGGYVLDAGARDFTFARGLAARKCKVVAIDADPTVEDPYIIGVAFANVALDASSGKRVFLMDRDPQARRIVNAAVSGSGPLTQVFAVTIEDLMARYEVPMWDAVKLDIEGAEYSILKAWPGTREMPIAKQISIEFHEHCEPRPQSVYDEIFAHLGTLGYEAVQHEKTARHCLPPSYWDSLLIHRGL